EPLLASPPGRTRGWDVISGRQMLWAAGFAALGAAVALGVNAFADGGGGGDGDPSAGATNDGVATPRSIPAPVRPNPESNPEAAELFDIVTGFQDLELHARYRVSLGEAPDRSSEIEIWQKDGQFRQEADARTPGGEPGA